MDYIEHKMVQKAASRGTVPIDNNIFSALNLALLSLLAYRIYRAISAPKPFIFPLDTPAVVFRKFTPRTLLPYDGTNNMPVYLAVRGKVFDVSSGRSFYGPGGPYANFAGRDASRGLACHSFDEDMLTKDLDGALDRLEGLNKEELETLEGWEERFQGKYLVVGTLVAAEKKGKMVD